jgi:hypothetical protein
VTDTNIEVVELWCQRQARCHRTVAAVAFLFYILAPLCLPQDQYAEGASLFREAGKTPVEGCLEWCSLAEITRTNIGKEDPCRHCSPAGLSPAFATDKLSAGVLEASTTTLTWRLLRAPDGLVLDSIALSKWISYSNRAVATCLSNKPSERDGSIPGCAVENQPIRARASAIPHQPPRQHESEMDLPALRAKAKEGLLCLV